MSSSKEIVANTLKNSNEENKSLISLWFTKCMNIAKDGTKNNQSNIHCFIPDDLKKENLSDYSGKYIKWRYGCNFLEKKFPKENSRYNQGDEYSAGFKTNFLILDNGNKLIYNNFSCDCSLDISFR